jgi:two-component system sensor histidine kinase TctE
MARTLTLRRQLIVWVAAPLCVLWSISAVVDYDIAHQFVTSAYDRSLLDSAIDIGKQIKIKDGRLHAELPEVMLEMLVTGEPGRFYYQITGPQGEFVAGNRDLPPPPEPDVDKVSYYDAVHAGKRIRVAALYLPLEGDREKGMVLVQAAETLTARTDYARQIMLRMMTPQVVLIVLAGLAVWYAVRRGLAPLTALRREIARRSDRDFSALPEEHTPGEVRPLIHAMNDLLERLSRALAAQQRFIADAAHQLRTPIAGIRTQTELALRQAESAEARTTLRHLQTATEQTTRLINQLLALARAEPGAERARSTERLDLGKLARETTTEWVPRALGRDIDLGFDSPPAAAGVQGNAFLLKEMLNNLLDNAIRYTQTGGQVTVRVTPDTTRVVLSVEDNGPGIPVAERERAFERFHRVLGTGVEGCGLGLAIVREIAQSHGGDAALDSGTNGAGTLVKVTLPMAA